MRIIEITAMPNGAHRNQESDYFTLANCPDGWAVIPDEMECENFPFGAITVEDGIVTSWTPGVIPEDPEPEPSPGGDGDVWDEMAAAIREGVNDVE